MKPKLVSTLLALLGLTTAAIAADEPNLVPWPESLELGEGQLRLTPAARIVPTDESLSALAMVLRQEIFLATELPLAVERGEPRPGDIVLRLEPELNEERHTLSIGDRVEARGGDLPGVAMATASLLQALAPDGTLPHLELKDRPFSSYRGLLIDVARQWHTLDTLKQLVVLCRLYKVRSLQIHLTDDQSFTFPSEVFPKLPSVFSDGRRRHYTREELAELVEFAGARGVMLIPELDLPGHSTAMRKAMPELFGRPGLSVLDLAREEVYVAVETILDEIMDVFHTSPYIHLGADEVWLGALDKEPSAHEAVKAREFDSLTDLQYYFVVRMIEKVKSRGREVILWEGFHGDGSRKVKFPKDVLIIAWETMYQLPQSLLAGGYTIVNGSWQPTYITPGKRWSPEHIYGWNMYRWENFWIHAPSYTPIQLEPDPRIIGVNMCIWEGREEMALRTARSRLPALMERGWAPDLGRTFEDFDRRWRSTDRLLERLVHAVRVEAEGLIDPDYVGGFDNVESWFGDELTVRVSPVVGGTQVHYTLDGSTPTIDSPVFGEPIVLTETTWLKTGVFDDSGAPLGQIGWREYECHPIEAKVEGLLMNIPHDHPGRHRTKFGDSVRVALGSYVPDSTIRYTTDGKNPSADSAAYDGPLSFEETVVLKARAFGAEGQARGELLERRFEKADYQPNLFTGRPYTASMDREGRGVANALDGVVDRDHFWDASPAPQWIQVDLERPTPIGRLELVTYWDGGRFYEYQIEVSLDGESWVRVVDGRENREVATPEGYLHEIDPVEARHVRVTLLRNSANPGLHIVELRAFEE